MVLMSNANMSPIVINRQIGSALNLVVFIRRYPDGVRRVESISELVGMEGNIITMQEIAMFVQRGLSQTGECLGGFKLNAVKPKFLERAKTLGIAIPPTVNGVPPTA